MKPQWLRLIALALLCLPLLACATTGGSHSKKASAKPPAHKPIVQNESDNQAMFRNVLKSQSLAKTTGMKILKSAQTMLKQGVVIKGSCWDFISAVYAKAGYPEKQINKVYLRSITGPYVDKEKIQLGDWLMFKNFSFNNIEHSAIFVAWVDRDAAIALTISYVGQSRSVPGRIYQYDLSACYGIRRAH